MDERDRRRIEIAERLFAGWSSGDPDGPRPFLHPDATLHDVAAGTFHGWPAIREHHVRTLAKWDEWRIQPDAFWVRDDGVAVHSTMSGVVRDPYFYGADFVGRRWVTELMTSLRFDAEDLVVHQGDFHDLGSRARSLLVG